MTSQYVHGEDVVTREDSSGSQICALNEQTTDDSINEVVKTNQFQSLLVEQKKFWSDKNIVFRTDIDTGTIDSKCAYSVGVYADMGDKLGLRQVFLVDKEHGSVFLVNSDGEPEKIKPD